VKKKTISDKTTYALAVFVVVCIVVAVMGGAYLLKTFRCGPAVSSSDCPPCSCKCKCNEEDRP
jgi:hypothetical protein